MVEGVEAGGGGGGGGEGGRCVGGGEGLNWNKKKLLRIFIFLFKSAD